MSQTIEALVLKDINRKNDYKIFSSNIIPCLLMQKTMPLYCSCSPSSHKGSFRCRKHRVATDQSIERNDHGKKISAYSWTKSIVHCVCAPTNHPGSFRCRHHRSKEETWNGHRVQPSSEDDKEKKNNSNSKGYHV